MDNMLSAALREFTGLLEQLVRNLLGHDAKEWGDELKHFLRKEPCWAKPKAEVGYLRLISGGEEIVIGAVDDLQTIAQAGMTFSYIDPEFLNPWTDVIGQSTPNTSVHVYELSRFRLDVVLAQILGSLKVDLNKLCLTQSQIIRFVRDHSKWLRRDSGTTTHFLFKASEEFLVAYVHQDVLGRLEVQVLYLSQAGIRGSGEIPWFVVPQL